MSIPAARANFLKRDMIEKWISYQPSIKSLDEDIQDLEQEIDVLTKKVQTLQNETILLTKEHPKSKEYKKKETKLLELNKKLKKKKEN